MLATSAAFRRTALRGTLVGEHEAVNRALQRTLVNGDT